MNVTLPEKEKINKKRISIYMISIILCVLALIAIIIVQILGSDVLDSMVGINKLVKRTDKEEENLKANFESILLNEIKGTANCSIQKEKNNEDIIYTCYEKNDKNENYEIDVNLPYINIKNSKVQNFNKEINNTFKVKAEEILKSKDTNSMYIVKYEANIENDILSIIIYSNLKQNTNAQRSIVQTFTYNLAENKEMNLEDVINMYGLNKNDVQAEIKEEVKQEQKKADDLRSLGYNVFSRDLESNIYKINNITEFFVYNNNIYIVFAYGNEGLTSEMDLVII